MRSKNTAQVPGAARVIKKYPNRRLYDTTTSSYITLTAIRRMVAEGEDFVVRDAKTGQELTRSILLQILVEAETGATPMFSTDTLACLIRCYGMAVQKSIGESLESSLRALHTLPVETTIGAADAQRLRPLADTAASIARPAREGLQTVAAPAGV